jgi:signal transduction histidine kinase
VSGIAEIDKLSAVLVDSFDQVVNALARERRLSADISHQLRTPITSLRLRLDMARAGTDPTGSIDSALIELDRIESTITHLLALARDTIPGDSTVRLDLAAANAGVRWEARARQESRGITVNGTGTVTTRGSTASVEQVLDVLIDNAFQHGDGDITITWRSLAGGGAIDVTDQGSSLTSADAERIFTRGQGRTTGIGLALARALAEADGGRLLLINRRPTMFSLVLLEPDDPRVGDDFDAPLPDV